MARIIKRTYAVLLALAALPATPALADSKTGGATALASPEVSQLRCETGERQACAAGQPLRVSGENLARTQTVVFMGGSGAADDRRARPVAASPHRVLVRVPSAARTGRLRVITAQAASARGPRLRVLGRAPPPALAPATPPGLAGGVFPVQGEHDFGAATNGFGGPRDHKGQDVFAACGTPIVAALGGDVTLAKFHDRAGNYAVIKADDGTSQAYMHMRRPAAVERGQRIAAGQPVGEVGDTGHASGCHLHFEIWTAPGWYEGGEPVDPLPDLQRWDAAS